MSLYTLSQAQRDLLDQIEAHTDPETGELCAGYADALDASEGLVAQKLEAIEAYRRELAGNIAMYKAEEDSLARKRKSAERKREALLDYMARCMDLMGFDRINAGLFELLFAATPASVLIADEAAIAEIPERFLRRKAPEIDKTAVKDALKAGEDLPWATLQAGRVLRVK